MHGYSKTKRLILVAMVITAACCLVASACVYSVGQNDVTTGTNSMMQTLYDNCLTMNSTVSDYMDTLDSVSFPYDADELVGASSSICADIKIAQEAMSSKNQGAELTMIIVWSILCLPPVLGIASWLSGNVTIVMQLPPYNAAEADHGR